jgi:uncharacterized protein YecA (UPF0149 family)
MKQIDNRQKKQIQMRAAGAPKKGNIFGHKKEKTRIPDSSSNEPETPQAPSVPTSSPISKKPEVGRNDPCPCGSGKKFKKCCLLKSDVKH